MTTVKLYNIYNHVVAKQALCAGISPLSEAKLGSLFENGYVLTYCPSWSELASAECQAWLEKELRQSCRKEVHCGDFFVWYNIANRLFYVEELDWYRKKCYVLANSCKGFESFGEAIRFLNRRRPTLEMKIRYS